MLGKDVWICLDLVVVKLSSKLNGSTYVQDARDLDAWTAGYLLSFWC